LGGALQTSGAVAGSAHGTDTATLCQRHDDSSASLRDRWSNAAADGSPVTSHLP